MAWFAFVERRVLREDQDKKWMVGLVAYQAPQDTSTSQKLGWWSFLYRVVWELLPSRLSGVACSLPAVCVVLPRLSPGLVVVKM